MELVRPGFVKCLRTQQHPDGNILRGDHPNIDIMTVNCHL
ncbi:hypothetical protein I553_4791 [Mycobacterium xenopi 4042]|uniref:Uncharacterized protein n=1 Tax=Mycobacterium xenopi 4042 TaxID=1299334 RepID=X8AG38_MYCXE|nr:hypothetical protein I553_4791 [Mycobacterium xenopi 4042]